MVGLFLTHLCLVCVATLSQLVMLSHVPEVVFLLLDTTKYVILPLPIFSLKSVVMFWSNHTFNLAL